MKKMNKKSTQTERARLLEVVKYAMQDLVCFKGPSYEETIEDLQELQADLEGFIDSFESDIKNRDDA